LKDLSDENQTECHEIEPNPSKDRAMAMLIKGYKINLLKNGSVILTTHQKARYTEYSKPVSVLKII
jgi:hypothetical protein